MQPKLTVVPSDLPEPPYPKGILYRGWTFDLNLDQIEQSSTWIKCPLEIRPWLVAIWYGSWRNAPCGSYPDDEEVIAGKIGMPLNLFKVHRDVLLRGWQRHSDGRLYHCVVTELVLKMISKRTSDRVRQSKHREKNSVSDSEQNHTLIPKVTRDSHDVTASHVPPPPPPQKKDLKQGQKKNTSPIASAEFENFWTSYGKKVGRQAALREWSKLDPQGDLLAKVLQAAVAQSKLVEAKFRKDPERWLRDRRWEDQLPSPVQAAMPIGSAAPRNWGKVPGV